MGSSSKSSSETSSSTTDARAVGTDSAIVAGQNAQLTINQSVGDNVLKIFERAAQVIEGVAGGAGEAVNKALATTQAVAERNQVSPTGNAVADVLKTPVLLTLAAGGIMVAYFARKK